MKKLIALLIVLVVPMALAGPWYDVVVTPGTDVVIGEAISVSIVAGSNIGGSFGGATLTVSNGVLTSADALGGGNWLIGGDITSAVADDGFTLTLDGTRGIDAGIVTGNVLFSFTYTGVAEGLSVIDASAGSWGIAPLVASVGQGDGADAVLPYETVNVTPEPMTMALLGLGGLFLRRRRA